MEKHHTIIGSTLLEMEPNMSNITPPTRDSFKVDQILKIVRVHLTHYHLAYLWHFLSTERSKKPFVKYALH